jgi:hypothetical protein
VGERCSTSGSEQKYIKKFLSMTSRDDANCHGYSRSNLQQVQKTEIRVYEVLMGRTEKSHLGNLGLNGKIILKSTLHRV